MYKTNLLQLFMELVQIPSPSGKERVVGLFIQKYLAKRGIISEFDGSGTKNNSNSGNLIAKLQGEPNLPVILFVAHMDTVETGNIQIKPKIENEIITSDGATILGADDKVSVASLMLMLEEIRIWPKHPTVLVAFTTREEKGKMGSSVLNISEKIDYCFNLDGPNNLGSFVYQTLGETPFEIKLTGKAVHAAVEPEKGINAIMVAAEVISKLPIGKDKKGTVLNIGKIEGGRANNIVPDEVVLYGEARAYLQKDLDKLLQIMENIISNVCFKTGCSFKFYKKLEEGAPSALMDKNHPIVKIAKKSTISLGLPFSLEKGSYTCDANFLATKYPTLNIARGSKMPHSFDESISVENLFGLKALVVELVNQLGK